MKICLERTRLGRRSTHTLLKLLISEELLIRIETQRQRVSHSATNQETPLKFDSIAHVGVCFQNSELLKGKEQVVLLQRALWTSQLPFDAQSPREALRSLEIQRSVTHHENRAIV
eukprot:5840390-Amphidinium_carterae.1